MSSSSALNAAVAFFEDERMFPVRDLFRLKSVSKATGDVVLDALKTRVDTIRESDVPIVISPPTVDENIVATRRAELEHEAWLAELTRSKEKQALLIECLESRLRERKDGRGDGERRCLVSEKTRLAAQERSLSSSSRRLRARIAKATDRRRFYDTAGSLVACRLAASSLSRLRALRIDLSDAPRFVSEQTDRVVSAIASSSPSLRSVSIASSPGFCGALTDDGLRSLENLQHLSLKYCSNVTDRGVVAVIQSSPNLNHLDLQFCVGVSDETLFALANAAKRDALLELNINRKYHQGGKYSYGPQCTDAGIISLASGCTHLRTLHAQGYAPLDNQIRSNLTSAAFDALASAPHLCFFDAQGTHDCNSCRHQQDCTAYQNLQSTLRARRRKMQQPQDSPPPFHQTHSE